MTTVAFDGITLAVDSQMSSGHLKFGFTNKLFTLYDDRLVAFTGDSALIHQAITYLNSDMEKPFDIKDGDEMGGIVIAPNGVFEFDKHLRMFPACVPWAGGSGETIALTAMHLGKSAVEAVEIACKLDKHSGLPVKAAVISINPA